MTIYKLFIISTILCLTACQTSSNLNKDKQKGTSTETKTTINLQDEEHSHQIEGKNVLTQIGQGCQLDQIFNHPNNQNITYRYIFKGDQLLSASTIMLDERNPQQMTSIWVDPEYTPTIENFERAKSSFSESQLERCKSQ